MLGRAREQRGQRKLIPYVRLCYIDSLSVCRYCPSTPTPNPVLPACLYQKARKARINIFQTLVQLSLCLWLWFSQGAIPTGILEKEKTMGHVSWQPCFRQSRPLKARCQRLRSLLDQNSWGPGLNIIGAKRRLWQKCVCCNSPVVWLGITRDLSFLTALFWLCSLQAWSSWPSWKSND